MEATLRKTSVWALLSLFILLLFQPDLSIEAAISRTRPDPFLLENAYSAAEEVLTYEVSWLGIPAGNLVMRIVRPDLGRDDFRIEVDAATIGILAALHPIEDHFETIVRGSERLPVSFLAIQEEGLRRNRKITTYDQKSLKVTYVKNDRDPVVYDVPSPVHNEFSSFLFMRTLPMHLGSNVTIPTFADKKAHAVEIRVKKKEALETILGPKETLLVEPRLTFKGLYDNRGNALIWLTDDKRRIPVRVKAEVKIGSLVADLIRYQRIDRPRAEAL